MLIRITFPNHGHGYDFFCFNPSSLKPFSQTYSLKWEGGRESTNHLSEANIYMQEYILAVGEIRI